LSVRGQLSFAAGLREPLYSLSKRIYNNIVPLAKAQTPTKVVRRFWRLLIGTSMLKAKAKGKEFLVLSGLHTLLYVFALCLPL
jgi:hypothetical protein